MDRDDLYGVPLERFVAERTALIRELRTAGRRDEAKEVGALRKPSIAAWAVNQLVRTQERALSQLLTAGDALRDAQAAVLAGQADAGSLRRAANHERAAVDTLLDAARGLLSSEGHELSPVVIDRVGETLHAAATDEEARTLIASGRLERELRHVGLGAAFSAVPAASGTAPRAKSKSRGRVTGGARESAPSRHPRAAPRERTGSPEQASSDEPPRDRPPAPPRSAERKAARIREAEIRRAAERAAKAVQAAQQRRERAADTLHQRDEELAAAEADARTAADAHCRARVELDALEDG